MFSSTSRVDSIIKYSLIITLYYLTGGAFSYSSYSDKIILMFFAVFVLFIFHKRIAVTNAMKAIEILMFMVSLILLVPLINNEINLGPYIAIPMQLSIGFIMCYLITFEEFKEKYINIIVFFASVSLVGYFISIIYPNIINHFPVTYGESSVDYYDAVIYVFMKAKGYDTTVLLARNAGICWEPGAYQVFLNLGILFLLENISKGKTVKRFELKLVLLILTVLTTFSTNGYLILILLMFSYRRITFNKLTKKPLITMTIIFIVIVFVSLKGTTISFLSLKFSNEFADFGAGAIDRISLDKIKYLFSENTFYFFGMSFSTWITYNVSMWNSIIHTMLCLGIPFTTLHLYLYYKFSKHFDKRTWLVFIILIMSFSTEALFWRTFFNYLAFSGILHNYRKDMNRELSNYDKRK